MDEFSYRPNSHKSKEASGEDKKELHKIVSGKVTTRKKSGVQKFLDSIVSEDTGSIRSSILNDIVVPVIKEAIANVFSNGSGLVNTLLFGDAGRGKSRTSGASAISYRRYYEPEKTSARTRNAYDFDSIVIGNRGEAEDVLDKMNEIIEVYGSASVADFYELVGVTGDYTANKFGWTDIHGASIVRVRTDNDYGYIIRLPKAYPLH